MSFIPGYFVTLFLSICLTSNNTNSDFFTGETSTFKGTDSVKNE